MNWECFFKIMLFLKNVQYDYMSTTGCSWKIVFFSIHCNPSLAFIAVRDLQSSQHNASVQSLLLAGNFLYNQKQLCAGEGEVKTWEFLEKKAQYLQYYTL